ncbi:MAG: glycosyltransferase [Ramlibacter sp.]
MAKSTSRSTKQKSIPQVNTHDSIDEEAPLQGVQQPSTPSPVSAYEGHVDVWGPSVISGWVCDRSNLLRRLNVELLVSGTPVSRVSAKEFREDVLEAGRGDGFYGFELPIPENALGLALTELQLRIADSDYLFSTTTQTSRETTSGLTAEIGDITVELGALTGWACLSTPPNRPLSLNVIDVGSGEIVAKGTAQTDPSAPRTIRFRIGLPASLYDGRAHAFSVRMDGVASAVKSTVVQMPFAWTPETALLQYARTGFKASLSTTAGFRYESLIAAIEKLAGSDEARVVGRNKEVTKQTLAQLIHVHNSVSHGADESAKFYAPLRFPSVTQPMVSIVIPVHNKFHVTYHCLASLLLGATDVPFEVILVDDGSDARESELLNLIDGVRHIRNADPLGFVRACNLGASQAVGEYIVMLNNDTEVTARWLEELLWPFEHFSDVGMVGAKLLYPDGTLQEAGGIVWNSGNPMNYGRHGNPHDPRYNYARQTDYLSGACVMLPRKLWNELDGFSEAYIPAYFEDTDLAFKVRERGYKTVYAPTAVVVHFEGISNGKDVSSGIKKFQEINRPKFKSRWISACRNNGKEGTDPDLNKDRNIQFRALLIDAQIPMPDKDAGSFAAIQEIRMLQGLGFKCTFVPQNLAWMSHYTENLQRMGVECLHAPYVTSIEAVLESRGSEFDMVYVTRYYVAQSLVEKIRRHAPQAKIVLNNADLHFLRELRAAMLNRSDEAMSKAIQTRDQELAVMRNVDLVLSYTDVEKAVIESHNLNSTRVAKCPWVTDIAKDVPSYAVRKDVAFLGGFNHLPNSEAVEWFAHQVLPLLDKSMPGVKVRIYGSNVPKNLMELARKHSNLLIEGWVAEVSEVYNQCRVFVAPLQTGAGIKGKVIGALAHGVPCVLSPIAAEGIPLSNGMDALIATKPTDWVAAIGSVYDNEKAWAKMSSRALSFAQAHYGLHKGVLEMQDALRQCDLYTDTSNNTLAAIC